MSGSRTTTPSLFCERPRYAEVKTMIKNYANGLVELNLLNAVNDPETKNANGSPVCTTSAAITP